ncbi:MAG: glycosyl transferase [Leptolyngbyaceae cyanobacterium CSU_1_3]|nr:glycosyl transferase [Leptolyngbyaceae cyanobacterium CSU_1_3]
MKQIDRGLALAIIVILGCLLGMLGFVLWDKPPAPVDRVAWAAETQWIGSQEPGYSFYARRSFDLAENAQAGWLKLSADNDFVLYVNGKDIAKEVSTVNNSLGFASKLSESFQNVNDSNNYRSNGGAFYALSNSRDWKLTTYIDLTHDLHPGTNTIAIAIQKNRQNPRVVVEGAVYSTQGSDPIDLSTGATPWKVSALAENRNGLRWFDPEFPDQNWAEANAIAPIQSPTYSRLSRHLFDRFLAGNWITGMESAQGEVWLRSNWQIPTIRQRAFVRIAGDGEYALLLNGRLVNRFGANDGNELHLYEVTNLLKSGSNALAVRLARPLDPDWSTKRNGTLTPNGALGFLLDGWVETDRGEITATIATDSTWATLSQPISGWAEGLGQGQPATVLESPDPQTFKRTFEGDAYLLDYPNFLWHQSLWQIAATGIAAIAAWGLGRFWLGRPSRWDSITAGTGLLLPGTLFLIGIGLLKHRYAESERGLLFAQSQSSMLVCLGFVGIAVLMLLWSQMRRRQTPQNSLVENLSTARSVGAFPIASLQTSLSQNPQRSGLEICPPWVLWFLLGLVLFVGWSLTGGIAISWASGAVLAYLGVTVAMIRFPIARQSLASMRRSGIPNRFQALLRTHPDWHQWLLLSAIVVVGFMLRVYQIGFESLDTDESISFDAIRGILRTGAPEATSGIWYTRSPFYHYMVALWLQLVGNSAVNVRLLSALWGTATLVVAFVLARQITGKIWVALVVTALLAIDPWQLWYSRFIRFYQVLQCLSLVSFWSFYKGFIEREGKRYQYIFFVAVTLTLLSQEVTITLLPCFLIGFLFFYRPFRWSTDWTVLAGSATVMSIYVYDVIFFSIKCLTPWIALSSGTESYLKPHLRDIAGFLSCLFVGPSRVYTIYSVFFLLGFAYFLKRRDGKLTFFFSLTLLYVLSVTILLYQITPRYTFPVYPLLITLAVHSAVCLLESLGRRFESILKGLLPLRQIAIAGVALLLMSNIEPGRVLASYHDSLVRRNIEVFEYVHDRRQPGDVVISPTPSGAAIVLGGLDYFFPSVLPVDALYFRDGRMIDRVSRSVIISNLDQVSHILEQAKRVWIHLDDAKDNAFTPEVSQYLETIGQPVMETFGARLRLWQRDDGILPRVRNQGRDLGAY